MNMILGTETLYHEKTIIVPDTYPVKSWTEAIRVLEEARSKKNHYLEVDLMLTTLYDNIGNHHAAISIWEDIMIKHKEYKIACLTMIGIEYSLIKLPEAKKGIEYFTEAILLTKEEVKNTPYMWLPTLANLYMNRANLYRKIGSMKKAGADLNELSNLMGNK
jgi:tetratricopeptide (TPR) repeat protein